MKKFINFPLSKKLRILSYLYYYLKTQIVYKLMFRSLGSRSVIRPPLLLTPECISIGRGVYIFDDARIEGISSYANKSFSPHIVLEDGVILNQRCHITAADTLVIGKNTTISFDVSIQDTDHEYEDLSLPILKQPIKVSKTQIGENCFIGSGAKIQAGTILGRHCVVGTNAVVRGHFPDYCVIAGVPARIIKQYNPTTNIWERVDPK